MHWHFTLYVLPVAASAVICAWLAYIAWHRRPAPGATAFCMLMLAVAEWALAYALELVSPDLPSSLVTVEDGKLDVHEDEIGPLLCHGCERLLAVFGFHDLVIGGGEQIAHDLAHFDLCGGSGACGEADGLHIRINHCPLSHPVIPNAVMSVDMATFHAVRPHNIRVHGRQERFHVAGIETIVEAFQEFCIAGRRSSQGGNSKIRADHSK